MGILSNLSEHWRRQDSAAIYICGGVNAPLFSDAIAEEMHVSSAVTESPWRIRNRLLHLRDVSAWRELPLERIARRNVTFLNWQLGETEDVEVLSIAQHIVAPSTEAARRLQSLGVPAESLAIIPHGVDLSQLVPRGIDHKLSIRKEAGLSGDEVCVGLIPPKGEHEQDELVEAVRVASAYVDDLLVVLTGQVSSQFQKRLRQGGLRSKRVAKMHDFYGIVDTSMIASDAQADSTFLLESWSSGVPVVALRRGFAADHVVDGINGGLAESYESLAGALIDMINDRDHQHGCRRRALEDVRRFDWPNVAKLYADAVFRPALAVKNAA